MVDTVGGIVIEEDSDIYAYKQGLFVITESGKAEMITNDNRFKPKI